MNSTKLSNAKDDLPIELLYVRHVSNNDRAWS